WSAVAGRRSGPRWPSRWSMSPCWCSPADPCHALGVRRNDPAQYDDLAGEWWRPEGQFCMLHWLAKARGGLIPDAERSDAVLVDVGCGAGLLAPHVAGKGYRH